jgi:hypothetical protein
MEKKVAKFATHAEAEKADRAYYQSLTPEERLRILFELVQRGNASAPARLERVYRITQLKQG